MMETARIRSAGYPIRYEYTDFVYRYRQLGAGIGPAHRVNCQDAARRICAQVLGSADYQFGATRIYMKNGHDVLLESERSRVYLRHVLVLQRGFRRVIFWRWLRRHRDAALTIQKCWRARGLRQRFVAIRTGVHRLQARLRSRQLVHDFALLRQQIVRLQAHSRGWLTRRRLVGRAADKAHRMMALERQRAIDEAQLRRAGVVGWQAEAAASYTAAMKALCEEFAAEQAVQRLEADQEAAGLAAIAAAVEHRINYEEDINLVGSLFKFLPSSPDMEVRSKHNKNHHNQQHHHNANNHNDNRYENHNNQQKHQQQQQNAQHQSRVHQHNSVSQMITSFEAKSKMKKEVPTKLLSAPVNIYTYESRL